jgi:hypothetical protein
MPICALKSRKRLVATLLAPSACGDVRNSGYYFGCGSIPGLLSHPPEALTADSSSHFFVSSEERVRARHDGQSEG